MKPTKSALMKSYNAARKCSEIERVRLNRALGIAMSNGKWTWDGATLTVKGDKNAEYKVTREGCPCPDHTHRHLNCKHIVARWLLAKASILDAQAVPLLKAA